MRVSRLRLSQKTDAVLQTEELERLDCNAGPVDPARIHGGGVPRALTLLRAEPCRRSP